MGGLLLANVGFLRSDVSSSKKAYQTLLVGDITWRVEDF